LQRGEVLQTVHFYTVTTLQAGADFFSNNFSRTETEGLKMGYSFYFIINGIFIIQILEKQVCE